MRARVALSAVLLAGCAAPLPVPAPPPFAGAPPGPPAELGAPVAIAPPAPPPPAPAPTETAPPPPPPAPRPVITLEPPFRLDRRVFPAKREAFLADLAERTRWNKGGMGTLTGPVPPVPGHPAPKVILDVVRARGPLGAAEAQRVLRRLFWGKAVECFGLGAYKVQSLRGAATIAFGVSASGKILSGVRVTHSTFHDEDVDRCLTERLRGVPLPSARGSTGVTIELQIGHGDEPMPPPPSLVVPGEGELPAPAIRSVIEAALPAFEACYRPALAYAPELWGRLGIRFHVTEDGKTDEAFEVESRFPDERVTLCALRAARKLTFPKPDGGDLRFIVPLRFGSEEPGAAHGAVR
jgi:hypothetical protein